MVIKQKVKWYGDIKHAVNPLQQTWGGGLASDFSKKILGAGYLFFLRGDLNVLGGPYPF